MNDWHSLPNQPFERLQDFHYKEPNGRDQGINVRQKTQTLVKVRPRHELSPT